MKNAKILKLILDHVKTKQMCNHAVKKAPFVIRYALDQQKTN